MQSGQFVQYGKRNKGNNEKENVYQNILRGISRWNDVAVDLLQKQTNDSQKLGR